MRPDFVETKNVLHFLDGFSKLKDRGASEACFMLVMGEPGLGKTDTLEWYATQKNCVYVRALSTWSPRDMYGAILEAMGVRDVAYSVSARYRQLLSRLHERAMEADNLDIDFTLIVDEADHVAAHLALIEALRDLSDAVEVPFILVGMSHLTDKIARYKQVASRCAPPVIFQKTDFQDLRKLADRLCEVEVADDLLNALLKVSGGYTREIMDGLKAIERFGKKNSGIVTLQAMDGQTLITNRSTAKPIAVRA